LTPVLNDEGKTGRSFIKLVAALEEAELLCTVVLNTSTGAVIPPQAPLPRICSDA
jgi:transcriptional regulator of met regulon